MYSNRPETQRANATPSTALVEADKAAPRPGRPRWVDAKRKPDQDTLDTSAPAGTDAATMLREPQPCAMLRSPGEIATSSVNRAATRGTPGKLLAVALLRTHDEAEPEFLGIATDASKYAGWDPRSLIFEKGVKSICRTAAAVAPSQKTLSHLDAYHAFSERSHDIVAIALAEGNYPARAGFAAVRGALEGLTQQPPRSGRAVAAAVLEDCKDPSKADKIAGLALKVEDTKEVFLDIIMQTLERGEKLDGLQAVCEELGINARQFKRTAKEVKRSFQCCKIM